MGETSSFGIKKELLHAHLKAPRQTLFPVLSGRCLAGRVGASEFQDHHELCHAIGPAWVEFGIVEGTSVQFWQFVSSVEADVGLIHDDETFRDAEVVLDRQVVDLITSQRPLSADGLCQIPAVEAVQAGDDLHDHLPFDLNCEDSVGRQGAYLLRVLSHDALVRGS